jgi:ketosteroid isomerase-like protein
MSARESENISVVRAYLAAVESGATGDDLAQFFTADAIQTELPNRLNPHGGQSNLSTILLRAEQGQRLLRAQRFEVRSELAHDAKVAVEALWTGTLAAPFGELTAGAAMRAHFAMFFELEDGRIKLQRNYDCFEPW